jgi:carbamate kinase
MRVVIALGGNALIRRGEKPEAETQRRNLALAAQAIATIALENEVVVTHGNGPQVGLLALQAAACKLVPPYPLDILGAESEGMLGYLIEQELRRCLPGRQMAALLTLVEVAPDDPAFARPTKPIGPVYRHEQAKRLAAERHWNIAADGDCWRRVVASPEPRRILEIDTIRLLLQSGAVVICTGGGGIPVVARSDGSLHGVEAVIDKDLTSALLAQQVGADMLLLLSDVDAVYAGWATPDAAPIQEATPEQLRTQTFAPGSMAPKIKAACCFAESGGIAVIGNLQDAGDLLAGRGGTRVRRHADDSATIA